MPIVEQDQKMSQEEIEQRFKDFQPLLNNICASFIRRFPFLEWDDLYNQLALYFVELCHGYTSTPQSGYERGVDFPYYAKVMLSYSAWNYVRKELTYRSRFFSMGEDYPGLWERNTEIDVEHLVHQFDFDRAMQYLKEEHPEDYALLLSFLEGDGKLDRKFWNNMEQTLGLSRLEIEERLVRIYERIAPFLIEE